MAKNINLKKTTTTHPRTGSQLKVADEIYVPFKAAILQSLKGSKGKTFSELTDDVAKIIRQKIPVETFTVKGNKMNRLKK